MRVALLSWESKFSIAVGGLAEHVTELATALHRRGHDVHVFTRIGAHQSGYECVDGVHYHRCSYEPHPEFLIDNQHMCDSFTWHLAEAESYLKTSFDIVHGHDWLSVRALTQLKDRHARPVVLTMHSTEYGRCGNQLFEGVSRRIREIEWEGTYIAERVICVSGVLRKEIQDLYSVPADKLDVIYNGIDVKRFDARVNTRSARQRFSIGRDDPVVLFAGRMTRQKGPDILVEALPGLLRDHTQAKFVFAGDGDLRSGLEQRAAALGVAPATRFVGHRAGHELVSLFKSADVVCVPSRNEPFGIVILEAWSARKPVVATHKGGPAEFVKHDDTGLTVSDQRDSIAWGVGTLLANKAKGRRMGRNGRKEAETRFSWSTIAAATERIYQITLSRRLAQQRTSETQQEVPGMARQTTGRSASTTSKTAQAKQKPGKTTIKTKPTAKVIKKSAKPTAARSQSQSSRTTRRSPSIPALTPENRPTQEQIRHRAYEIYLARGCAPGDPKLDWLQAERELLEQLVVTRKG